MKAKASFRLPILAVSMAAFISGCATTSERDSQGPRESLESGQQFTVSCSTTLSPEHRVELDAIDAMMASSDNYAALARLEAMPFETQHHWLRWAQLLGKVEQLEYSEEAYLQVAQTCDSSEAYHGLGVVYVKAGKLAEGIQALADAKSRAPASADIRNDFGIVLMQGGFFGQAAFELRTAYELSGRKDGIGRNMVAAYFLHGGESALARVQRELKLDAEVVERGIAFSERFEGGSV